MQTVIRGIPDAKACESREHADMSAFLAPPGSHDGRRAVVLAAAGVALVPVAALLVNGFGLPSFVGALGLLGVLGLLAGGVLALLAIVRAHERSVFVLVTALAGCLALLFLVGELASPH